MFRLTFVNRSEDYRKLWKKKQQVQLISVFVGALIGTLPGLIDRHLAEFPHWVIEGAIMSSTLVNSISLYYY